MRYYNLWYDSAVYGTLESQISYGSEVYHARETSLPCLVVLPWPRLPLDHHLEVQSSPVKPRYPLITHSSSASEEPVSTRLEPGIQALHGFPLHTAGIWSAAELGAKPLDSSHYQGEILTQLGQGGGSWGPLFKEQCKPLITINMCIPTGPSMCWSTACMVKYLTESGPP